MVQEYRQIAQALSPSVDLFLAETLSTAAEARAALQATEGLGGLAATEQRRIGAHM